MRLPFPPSPLTVWAVDDTRAQLCWGDLPTGPVTAESAITSTTIDHGGGPGSIIINDLPAGRITTVEVSWRGGSQRLEVGTLSPPPGELLAQVATISDLHLGARGWGVFHTMTPARAGLSLSEDTPMLTASAAIAEAVAWGAERLVIKGDAAHHRLPEHFDMVGELVDRFPDLPMQLLPGNHDVDNKSAVPLPAAVGQRSLPYITDLDVADVSGLRVVAANVALEGRGDGSVDQIRRPLLDLVAETNVPVLLTTHQQFQKYSFVTHWPPGVKAPASNDMLADLAKAQPNLLLTSGHTHRNRVHRRHGVTHTEVASTRDWPGVWAGYKVFEGGLMQSAWRIASPEAMQWFEYSKNAVGGVWQRWAPGQLADRCVTIRWK